MLFVVWPVLVIVIKLIIGTADCLINQIKPQYSTNIAYNHKVCSVQNSEKQIWLLLRERLSYLAPSFSQYGS